MRALWLLGILASQAVPPEVPLLSRIRQRMADNLTRLPDYTCVETIERSRRGNRDAAFEPLDRLRLEVAMIGGTEQFAPADAGGFGEERLREWSGQGVASTGSFALHARALFVSSGPSFVYRGNERLSGREAVRFDFESSRVAGDYHIQSGGRRAAVPYRGAFWADPETLDILRIIIEVTEIPVLFDIAKITETIDYSSVRVAQTDFLLPRTSELRKLDFKGEEHRNLTTFSSCRQYTAESKLVFIEPPAKPFRPGPRKVTLPSGTLLELALEAEIDLAAAPAGEEVAALLVRPLEEFPKGAIARGRIVRIEKRKVPIDHWLVRIRFDSLQTDMAWTELRARLQGVRPRSAARVVAGSYEIVRSYGTFTGLIEDAGPGGGVVLCETDRLRRGLVLVWSVP